MVLIPMCCRRLSSALLGKKTVSAKTNTTAQLALVLSIFALLDLSTCHRPTPGSFTGYEYEIGITVNFVIRPRFCLFFSHIFVLFHCLRVSLFLTPRTEGLEPSLTKQVV